MDPIVEPIFDTLKKSFPVTQTNFAILKLAVDALDPQLLALYIDYVDKHNNDLLNDPFPNSGFDLFTPKQVEFDKSFVSQFVDLRVKCEMVYCDVFNNLTNTCAFVVHPRSSLSKTPLMLANHTGIIDAGYRGSLIGAFRCLPITNDSYIVEPYTRLLQICHPTLCPVFIILVNVSDLSDTLRGSGGFGSTGK